MCAFQRCAHALMQHGECIFTAVRVMDEGASQELLPAHNRPGGSGGDVGAKRMCVAMEEGLRVQGILSHRRSY